MNIEENVKKWLSDENLMREIKYDESADFHFIIEFPKDNIMDVVKPKGSDSIVIACGTQVSPEHSNLMKNADVNTRKNFIQNLNFGLNSFFVDFELQINNDILQQLLVEIKGVNAKSGRIEGRVSTVENAVCQLHTNVLKSNETLDYIYKEAKEVKSSVATINGRMKDILNDKSSKPSIKAVK